MFWSQGVAYVVQWQAALPEECPQWHFNSPNGAVFVPGDWLYDWGDFAVHGTGLLRKRNSDYSTLKHVSHTQLKQRHVRKGVRPNCHYNKVILYTLNFLINLYQHLCLPCARRVFLSGKCLNWNIMQWVVATRANALQKNKSSSSTRIKEVVHWKASQGWQPKDNNHRMFNNGKFWDCVIFFGP